VRIISLTIAVFLTMGFPLFGADADGRASLSAAAKRLADQPSFRWKTTMESEGSAFFRGRDPTIGQYEKNGYTRVRIPSFGGNVEFVVKGGKAAVLFEENWQTLEQAAASGGNQSSFFNPALMLASIVSEFKMPPAQVQEILATATNLKRDGDTIKATLSADVASNLLTAGDPFGRRRNRQGRQGQPGSGGRPPRGRMNAPIQDPKGSAIFWVKDGLLTKFALALSGTREFGGSPIKLDRVLTTTISDIGSTKVETPQDARDIIEALLIGKTPSVFVPEPGFKKLFNGRDLTGWAGRPEHWSVVDGAITGRTTKENPARGNNFLIAKKGDENLIVDDFELRLSYRINANNKSGFANSGIQYRSIERKNFVVAGYQADIEAGPRFSGILYDEAGGAGGRSIMAGRGQKVVWTTAGKKEVTGRIGKSEDIQKAIRKDDWNEYIVVARGNHLQHFINGVQTVDVVDDTVSKRLTSGILALQLHAGEPMTVQFKNIRIKSLSSASSIAAGNVKVAKDFQLEQIYLVPREKEGSWVTLCVDPKGRLITADQNGTLYRLTPPPPGQHASVKPEPLNVKLTGAHGLLYAFDSLYVMVNERDTRGLYRLRDTKGNDQFDEVKLLRAIEGGGEHGVHALVLSPDGQSIYVVCGNATSLTKVDSSRLPLTWSEDNLVTRIPTGFMDNSLAPQGWIARTDPEGKEWELIAAGFRNPFDAAFNRDGELFTYDADMEWDIGDPWYRPTRVNHVISGAEFGFRNGSGKRPDYYIDSFGSVVDIGPGSPTGIVFGYGAKFPAKYQEALYLCDWSFGKIRAVHLMPSGATYTGEAEEFLSGQPLPVCDLVINPKDGAMYFVVGGRGTQSALYRVTYTGNESTVPNHPETRFQERRQLRHRLESFHGHADAKAVETVWPSLSDPDRAIRYAARIALEWQDPAQWSERALGEKDARKAIAALVALARVSGKDELHRKATDPKPDPALQGRMLEALGMIDWAGLSHGDRLDLLRAYSLVFIRLGHPDETARQRLIAKVDPLFPTQSQELNILLANLLVYLQTPSAAAKIMAAFRKASTQEEQIDYALALRELKVGWTMPLREEYFRWFVDTASHYRGGNTFASSLRTIKHQAATKLSDNEKRALKPILEAKPVQKTPQGLLAARKFVKKWTISELVPIVERGLNGGRDFERGRRLYAEVACASCHRFGQEGGGSVGPDLTGVAGRFSVPDLLEALIEPSKVISDQYAAIVIHKTNGQVITGRVANLFGDSISVNEDMFDPGRLTNVRRADIESMEPSKVSMMPEGLLDSLKEEEILDLIAFLLTRGDRNHKMFQK
jgi:putative heme-binding domain-containing protein